MGGNALSFETKRCTKAEFNSIAHTVSWNLDHKHATVPAYFSKDSFGDMDVVVEVNDLFEMKRLVENIKEKFAPKEIVRNGPVISFDVEDFQIDFITVPESQFKFAVNYFAWNDLGNFIGRTAHRLGFKYGHDGLKYVLRDSQDDTYVVAELYLTQSTREALKFLDFDVNTFLDGFDTPEEIFDYASSSSYFDPATFVLANRNHTARVRDRKRKMYNACVEHYKQKFAVTDESVPAEIDKSVHLQRALETFPAFKVAYDNALAEHALNKAFKANFNGHTIGAMFNLEGKELGAKMKEFREFIDANKLKEFIASLPTVEFFNFVTMMNKLIIAKIKV